MEYKINLTYFKQSGKYYSEGSYKTNKDSFYDVIKEVKSKQRVDDSMPGLSTKGEDFIILVDSNSHPMAVPTLLNIKPTS